MMEPSIDDELVNRATLGDEQAFEQLINLSLGKLKALLCNKYRLQQADLDEVIQVSTIKVFKKINTFRSNSSFTTWFYIILRNEALDYIRKRNSINRHELPPCYLLDEETKREDYDKLSPEQLFEETAASLLEKKETLAAYRMMIAQILDELSPAHRTVLEMILIENLSYQEAAERLGVPTGTIMSRLFFARKAAQKRIREISEGKDYPILTNLV